MVSPPGGTAVVCLSLNIPVIYFKDRASERASERWRRIAFVLAWGDLGLQYGIGGRERIVEDIDVVVGAIDLWID